MSAQQINNAGSSNWLAAIPGFDEVTFKLRTCPIPGFMATPVQLPVNDVTLLKETGDRIEYEEMMCEFFIDSDWRNYRKLKAWIENNVKAGFADRREITVMLLDNQRNPQGVNIVFHDAFAYGMTQVDTDTNNEITDLTCTFNVAYTTFEFVDDPCEDC